MKKWVTEFLRDEEGASGIEYALIATMVAVVIATFSTSISGKITDVFSNIVTGLG